MTAGTIYRALDQPLKAEEKFRESIRIIEELRAFVAGGAAQSQSFAEQRARHGHPLIGQKPRPCDKQLSRSCVSDNIGIRSTGRDLS
jgi:hypothetical protein